jgi:hypothetical protein
MKTNAALLSAFTKMSNSIRLRISLMTFFRSVHLLSQWMTSLRGDHCDKEEKQNLSLEDGPAA